MQSPPVHARASGHARRQGHRTPGTAAYLRLCAGPQRWNEWSYDDGGQQCAPATDHQLLLPCLALHARRLRRLGRAPPPPAMLAGAALLCCPERRSPGCKGACQAHPPTPADHGRHVVHVHHHVMNEYVGNLNKPSRLFPGTHTTSSPSMLSSSGASVSPDCAAVAEALPSAHTPRTRVAWFDENCGALPHPTRPPESLPAGLQPSSRRHAGHKGPNRSE